VTVQMHSSTGACWSAAFAAPAARNDTGHFRDTSD